MNNIILPERLLVSYNGEEERNKILYVLGRNGFHWIESFSRDIIRYAPYNPKMRYIYLGHFSSTDRNIFQLSEKARLEDLYKDVRIININYLYEILGDNLQKARDIIYED